MTEDWRIGFKKALIDVPKLETVARDELIEVLNASPVRHYAAMELDKPNQLIILFEDKAMVITVTEHK